MALWKKWVKSKDWFFRHIIKERILRVKEGECFGRIGFFVKILFEPIEGFAYLKSQRSGKIYLKCVQRLLKVGLLQKATDLNLFRIQRSSRFSFNYRGDHQDNPFGWENNTPFLLIPEDFLYRFSHTRYYKGCKIASETGNWDHLTFTKNQEIIFNSKKEATDGRTV